MLVDGGGIRPVVGAGCLALAVVLAGVGSGAGAALAEGTPTSRGR
ncbi:hypothetical protein [Nocardia sp. CC201C]|nr:hypothetical protein [Nocardia sp. CC201C]